jgi:hypothetical protein
VTDLAVRMQATNAGSARTTGHQRWNQSAKSIKSI